MTSIPLLLLEPLPIGESWHGYLRQRGYVATVVPVSTPELIAKQVREELAQHRSARKPFPILILARPTNWPKDHLSAKDFQGIEVVLGWFGSGRERLKTISKIPGVRIVMAKTNPNAPATAELNVLLASALLRPIHKAFALPQSGETADFVNTSPEFSQAESLANKVWAMFGAGQQFRPLLLLLLAFRVREARVWNRDATDLADRLTGIPHGPIHAVEGGVRTTVDFGSRRMNVFFTDQKHLVLRGADVLSIHVPSTAEDGLPGPRLIDRELLSYAPPGLILINAARADHWDEAEIVNLLEAGVLRAVASDVFASGVEDAHDFEKSPLYVYAREHGSPLAVNSRPAQIAGRQAVIYTDRVLLTPHIGGCTDDSFEGFASEILPQL